MNVKSYMAISFIVICIISNYLSAQTKVDSSTDRDTASTSLSGDDTSVTPDLKTFVTTDTDKDTDTDTDTNTGTDTDTGTDIVTETGTDASTGSSSVPVLHNEEAEHQSVSELTTQNSQYDLETQKYLAYLEDEEKKQKEIDDAPRKLKPIGISLGFGLTGTRINKTYGPKIGLKANIGLHWEAGVVLKEIIIIGAQVGLINYKDDNSYTATTESLSGTGEISESDSSTQSWFFSPVAGLHTPIWFAAKRFGITGGVNVGYTFMSTSRGVDNCMDCGSEDFNVDSGLFVEPSVSLLVAKKTDNLLGGWGLKIGYLYYGKEDGLTHSILFSLYLRSSRGKKRNLN